MDCLSWLLQSCLRNLHASSKVSAVIELGCGHELCGVLARKLLSGSLDLSAVPCFLTDGEERALELARRTVDANGLGGAQENLLVSRLRWGDREDSLSRSLRDEANYTMPAFVRRLSMVTMLSLISSIFVFVSSTSLAPSWDTCMQASTSPWVIATATLALSPTSSFASSCKRRKRPVVSKFTDNISRSAVTRSRV